jgi:peptidoglycan/LPS O-acetylase OafA/YrhL
MRISLAFPVLLGLLLFSRWTVVPLATLSLLAYSLAVLLSRNRVLYSGETIALSGLVTIYFVIPFVAGILIALKMPGRAVIGPMTSGLAGGGVLAAFFVVQRVGVPIAQDVGFTAIASGLVVLTLSSHSAARVLSFPVLSWLGRVSYSLYLFHVIILNALFRGFSDRVDLVFLAAATIPLSLVVAELSNRLIERPSARLGRNLATAHASARSSRLNG